MYAYGGVTIFNAPSLEGFTQPAIIEFEIKYAACEEKLVDDNRTRTGRSPVSLDSIQQYMNP